MNSEAFAISLLILFGAYIAILANAASQVSP